MKNEEHSDKSSLFKLDLFRNLGSHILLVVCRSAWIPVEMRLVSVECLTLLLSNSETIVVIARRRDG